MYRKFLCQFAFLVLVTSEVQTANAATVKLTFDRATTERMNLVALSQTGGSKSTVLNAHTKKASISLTGASELFLRRANGSLALIASYKYTGTSATKSTVVPYFKKGTYSVKGMGSIASNPILIATLSNISDYKKSLDSKTTFRKSILLKNLRSHGQKLLNASAVTAQLSSRAIAADPDGDGLPSVVDSDNDGDGTLDNYDSDSADSAGSSAGGSFSLFSNFKTNIDTSLNLHTTGLSTSQIDSLMQSTQTLAIQVVGSGTETSELDCGSLGYCSSSGTGTALVGNTAFPDASDTDSDGLGEITRGPTGDFQLKTGASSSTISSGDTLLQYVNSGATTTTYTGLLNFVFSSNPAVKSVAVNSDPVQTINYSATPILGSSNNCIAAPATGDVSVTVVGWRPQRPGNATAGEASYVDLGNSLITFDIPNAPCTLSGGGGCPGSGPGNCTATAYTTTDSNLSSDPNGLRDNKGDVDADSSNTYTFTVNLSTCLNSATSGPISWSAGQTLFVDLQFRSDYGDNAAQKFCVKRADS